MVLEGLQGPRLSTPPSCPPPPPTPPPLCLAQVISPDQMRKGFLAVVEGLEDLRLDVPDALDLLSLFICRAVADDVLPPSFIKRIDGGEWVGGAGGRERWVGGVGGRRAAAHLHREDRGG